MTGAVTAVLPDEVEVAVIGGGIVGLCCALFLAREGREVALLDRAAPWSDASGLNAGTLSLQVKTPQVWDLTRLALALWQRLSQEVDGDLGFTRCGGLRVAFDEAERSRLRQTVDVQRSHGLDVAYLDIEHLRARAPWLGPEIIAATYCPDDAYASPLGAGPVLIEAAVRAGALIAGDSAVTELTHERGGYTVRSERGTLRSQNLIIAAGAATGALTARLGIALPVSADLNMMHITERAPPLMQGILTHIGGMLSLKQYPNGTCIIGGGWQGQQRTSDNVSVVDHENLHHNLHFAARAVPALAQLRLLRSWTGFEALMPDALPMVGSIDGYDGLYVAACARGGYTLGPAQAFAICEQLAGRVVDVDIQVFSPKRWLR